jgi:hypothetical protein
MRGLDPPAGPKPFGAAKARASINQEAFDWMDCRVEPGMTSHS